MILYKYKGQVPNFGDDLNDILWPYLLPDFFDDCGDAIFLGTGSILFENAHFGQDVRRIVVCGAGYGGYTAPPVLDQAWKIYFVRGPQTAKILGLDPEYGIGDSGSLVRDMNFPKQKKQWSVSFIPHWESMQRGEWDKVTKKAGIHLIDPRWSPQQVILHILASEKILCEAMHGAIVADALRVPWIPILPLDARNRMKWLDWAEAMDIPLQPYVLIPSTPHEHFLLRYGEKSVRGRVIDTSRMIINLARPKFIRRAAEELSSLAKKDPLLSSDANLDRAVSRMRGHIERMRHDIVRAGMCRLSGV